MQELAEEAKRKQLDDPTPPTAEELAAKEAAYSALSIKELREMCKQRPRDPAHPDGELGLDTSSSVEKADLVRLLLKSDAEAFDTFAAKHLNWKLNGCQGPPPQRPASAKPAAGEGEGGKPGSEPGGGPMGVDTAGLDEEQAARMQSEMDQSLPVFLETMVSASLLDVAVTLKEVTKKVLNDHSVSSEDRVKRAKALRVMGKSFARAKGSTKAARGEVAAKSVIEGTMMRTMAKAQGQEVDDGDFADGMVEAEAAEADEGQGAAEEGGSNGAEAAAEAAPETAAEEEEEEDEVMDEKEAAEEDEKTKNAEEDTEVDEANGEEDRAEAEEGGKANEAGSGEDEA
mmetsp:Transcript_50043/g.113605  ORF Transcript_50043/g.113605 Transcript_50043/m.113605 type:complete len:343 (-) Transcript_50043:187-1215(-)